MGKRKAKKNRAKVAYCVWCRRILKAGTYKRENNEAFCSDKCLSEWRVKQEIVHHRVEGQRGFVEKSGRSIGDIENQAREEKSEDIRRGELKSGERVTVEELLSAANTEKELRSISERLFAVKVRRTIHPAYFVVFGAVFACLTIILGISIIDRIRSNENGLPSSQQTVNVPDSSQAEVFYNEISSSVVKTKKGTKRAALSKSFTRGDVSKRAIALTFDAGAHLEESERLLDTLLSRGVKSTFFITGFYAKKYPFIVIRVCRDGHEIANHTFSHPHLTTLEQNGMQLTLPTLSQSVLAEELLKTDSILRALAEGCEISRFWRAPYGEINDELCAWGESINYNHVGWTEGVSWRTNLDTNDWVVNSTDAGFFHPRAVIEKIVRFGEKDSNGLNGGIVLMHIGTLRKENKMVDFLGELIDTLRGLDYSLMKVSEMMRD